MHASRLPPAIQNAEGWSSRRGRDIPNVNAAVGVNACHDPSSISPAIGLAVGYFHRRLADHKRVARSIGDVRESRVAVFSERIPKSGGSLPIVTSICIRTQGRIGARSDEVVIRSRSPAVAADTVGRTRPFKPPA